MRLGIDIGGTKTAALVLDDVGRHRRAGRGALRAGQRAGARDRGVRRRPGRGAGRGLGAHRAPRRLHARAGRPADRLGPARGQPRGARPRPGRRASRPPRGGDRASTTTSRPRPSGRTTRCGPRSPTARRPTSTSAPVSRRRSSTAARWCAAPAARPARSATCRSARACPARAGRTAASRPSRRAPRCTGCGRGPAADLFPAAAAGDERARAVVATLAHGIALAVQVLVVTGAELVVIGGGLARDRVELEAALAADIDARAAGLALPAPARPRVEDPGARRRRARGRHRGGACCPAPTRDRWGWAPDGGRRLRLARRDRAAGCSWRCSSGCRRVGSVRRSSGWRPGRRRWGCTASSAWPSGGARPILRAALTGSRSTSTSGCRRGTPRATARCCCARCAASSGWPRSGWPCPTGRGATCRP